MILVIDNYDSFTYNLVQLVGGFEPDITVKRNNEVTLDEIRRMNPARILISPGPGRPEDAGVSVEVIRTFGPQVPLLGVCLGHQAIGIAYGGSVTHAPSLMHGRTSRVRHQGDAMFDGVSNPFTATRYHSLVIDPHGVPDDLRITADTDAGVIMAVRHRSHPVFGVQFHPESILTEEGKQIVYNWMQVL